MRSARTSMMAAALLAVLIAPARGDVAGDRGGADEALDGAGALDGRASGRAREARLRTERARELYQRGDFGGASANYRAAYALRPSPGVLFNLAQAYRQDGRCAEAAGAYRAVLATRLGGPARELATRQLEASELCVKAVGLSELRSGRSLRNHGAVTMGAGGLMLALAAGMALADHDRRDPEGSPYAVGLALGGAAVTATGAVVFAVGQRRIRAHGVKPGVFRVPVGTSRVAGVTVRF